MTDPVVLKYLHGCLNVKPLNCKLQQLQENSSKFPVKFPVQTVLCRSISSESDVTQSNLEKFVKSAYPILHEEVISLYIKFLEYKKKYGSAEEKLFYAKKGIIELVDRFLKKRAVVFMGKEDAYVLLDGKKGKGGWEDVGNEGPKSALNLKDCLSYDEMKLSALLSVSSHSYFINDGNRLNAGQPAEYMENIQRTGVVIGLTGARFERLEKMEWEDVLVTKEQNTDKKGYGAQNVASMPLFLWRQMWASFYGLGPYLPLYSQVEKYFPKLAQRYVKMDQDYFDNIAYSNRMAISFETLLLEAQHRAEEAQTSAYIHVVGIGLGGAWMASQHQEEVFMDSFAYALKRLLPALPNVSDINFSSFKQTSCGGVVHGGFFYSKARPKGIQIHFSKRNPHEKIDTLKDKLLVVTYPWDSNALPGNEFWIGSLTDSGGSAEACSSQISELHNPHINSTRICGSNLHIATTSWGVIHVSEFARWKHVVSKTQTL
ncbi:uncharacterized protein LOC134528201 isoform X2 [Bacillus rossius redtenbacheri]